MTETESLKFRLPFLCKFQKCWTKGLNTLEVWVKLVLNPPKMAPYFIGIIFLLVLKIMMVSFYLAKKRPIFVKSPLGNFQPSE